MLVKIGLAFRGEVMSVRVRHNCLERVRAALPRNGFPSQRTLAEELGLGIDTVNRFLNSKPVHLTNAIEICERLGLDWREVTYPSQSEPEIELEPGLEAGLPSGPLPSPSPFYIERPPIEERCHTAIQQPGALIRIKAPRQMGKTSLIVRVFDQARSHSYQTVLLNLQLAGREVFTSLYQFLQWFCLSITQTLQLPNRLGEYWDDQFPSNYNCTAYFEKYLLREMGSPLVLGLDELDYMFPHAEIARDFFGLLRGWYEQARYGDENGALWSNLRLIVGHSTEVYIPLNVNQSPFNVGLPIELPEFNAEQVGKLAQQYGLSWDVTQTKQLMELVGGHPFLTCRALDYLTQEKIALDQLAAIAVTEAGSYRDHLHRHLLHLEEHPELATTFSQVVTASAPVKLLPELAFKLHSMGLVCLQGNHGIPRCYLYRQYFKNCLQGNQ
ncbi:MAG: serine/threonine protein kinase [Acaryochloris sp. RU_4_1]|nr:serine/threonine protein kinase [Acaryochloris sp. RU_4_1]NJR56926.1 serine/threonine protein kinase [Acaryochloris sp. CRU_2_0]